jgi:predicted N-acetyltransferase YhbS
VTVEIRPAEPTDEDALAALDRAAWTPFSSPGLLEEGAPFFDERTSPADVLVALEGGEVAGYVRVGRASRFASSEFLLDGRYVDDVLMALELPAG